MRDFKDRTVVVTGAASGIGRETALAFGRRGAHLAVIDVDEAGLARVRQELEGLGCLVYTEVVDVSRAGEMERFRDAVYDRFGRCDVLVNNAGVAIGGPVEHIPLEGWQRIMGINLWGVIHGCHFFYPRMIAQGGGSIVNIASTAAYAPGPALGAYACTKHGVLGLSETMRIEGAGHGVYVSTICPGVVKTPIYDRIDMNVGAGGAVSAEDITTGMRKFVERFGWRPERIALAVVDAVERRRGVVPVGPGAHVQDITRRISRESYNRSIRAVMVLGGMLAKRNPGKKPKK